MVNTKLDDNHQKLSAALAVICAYARLHELEAKRQGTSPGGLKLMMPLTGEEEREYAHLMTFWNSMGTDKQAKCCQYVHDLAHEAYILASVF